MRSEDFLKVIRQRPFRPFTIHVDEVMSFSVSTPEQVTLKPGSDLIVILPPGGRGDPGEAELVSLAHVSRLSFSTRRDGDDLNEMLRNFVD